MPKKTRLDDDALIYQKQEQSRKRKTEGNDPASENILPLGILQVSCFGGNCGNCADFLYHIRWQNPRQQLFWRLPS